LLSDVVVLDATGLQRFHLIVVEELSRAQLIFPIVMLHFGRTKVKSRN
jgi:hypothetical protein